MNEIEAIEYIHSVNWQRERPCLDRIKSLCASIGDPQNDLRFIHVAGTNGKGSFCSMLESVLRMSGMRVGLFTSPFILRFNERIKVNGEDITSDELVDIVEYIRPHADAMNGKCTEFELITAIGFEYFKRKGCDIVILECGMGGRLDPTNIIDSAVMSVITGISLDHTAFLGDTTEKIAREKAGIIKHGVPVLWCGQDADAYRVISERAKEMQSDMYVADKSVRVTGSSLDGTTFDCGAYHDMHIQLLGSYQPYNARNVICACEILNSIGYKVSSDDIYNGLSRARWLARFEIICKSPLFIFDGGHNPEGICAAIESAKMYFGGKRLCVITGVMADKDHAYMAEKISEIADTVYTVSPNNPRALDSEKYAEEFRRFGIHAESFESLSLAVSTAKDHAKEGGCATLVLGSLYMYGEVISELEREM